MRRIKSYFLFPKLSRPILYLACLGLCCFAGLAQAATYNFSGATWDSTYPTCNSGSWSRSGSIYTCTGTISLASGDKILPSGGITVVANGGITLSTNNTIGSSSVQVNLQTTYGPITSGSTGNTFYGNLTSSTGAINLTNATVTGSISTSGVVTLSGGSVLGSVTGNNGVTTTNGTVIGGNVNASNGAISLSGGSVTGSVYSNCCTVSTTNTNVGNGVSSGSNTVTINGGTISGPVSGTVSTSGGSGIIITGATITSGSILTSNVAIVITNSTVGSASNPVNISSNNYVTISGSTVYGNVSAGSWSSALSIDNASTVYGVCLSNSNSLINPSNYPRCATAPCLPPSNIPAGVTVSCVCDNFNRSTLNPSTIFNSNWWVSNSDGLGDPYINTTTGNLRLTENTANNAKAATIPGIFPAAGNYISVEFKYYAYNGSSADGVGVVLSDYSVTATPGAYGGSLGYAQKTGISGFNGGWIGIGIDEFGNYQNPTEGRVGGPGFLADSVAVRGSGSGTTGYRWLKGTASGLGIDSPSSTTPAPGHAYQVIVDARNSSAGQTWVAVNRDTTGGGSNYSSLITSFDAFAQATALGFTQSSVPANWKISFAGSTGGSNNIHELSRVRVCAQTVVPITGGTPGGFNAIDSYLTFTSSTKNTVATQGDIFTKLVGTPFTLQVAALNTAGTGVLTTYAASSNKTVTLELIDDSSGSTSCNASSSACQSCSKPIIKFKKAAGGADFSSQTMSFAASDVGGPLATPTFIVNNAYPKVLVRMNDGTTYGCSVDWFSVRPTALTSFSTTVSNTSATGTPALKAGSGSFSLSATATNGASPQAISAGTATMTNYTGTLQLAPTVPNGWAVGSFNPSTFAAASSGVATTAFTYGEAGYFTLDGYNPGTSSVNYNTTSQRGIYDNTWTAIDSSSGKVNCNPAGYENVLNTSGTYAGMYGCNFGLTSAVTTSPYKTSNGVGRFIPDHFSATGVLTTRAELTSFSSTTGSITAASTTLTVTSSTGISVGKALRIVGAGASGASLVAVVTAVSGTTVTLGTAASTTVSGATVYNLSSPSATQDPFSYLDEPMLLVTTVTAQNGNTPEGVTTNYSNATGLAKMDAATLTSNANWLTVTCGSGSQCFGLGAVNVTTAPTIPPTTTLTPLTSRLTVSNSIAAPGSGWVNGLGTFATYLVLSRAAAPDGSFDALNLGLIPTDTDGVTVPAATSTDTSHRVNLDADANGTNERRLVAVGKARYGRLRLSNAFGSDRSVLSVPSTLQYWSGNSWVTNTDDALSYTLTSPALSAAVTAPIGSCLTAGTCACYSRGTCSNSTDSTFATFPGNLLISNPIGTTMTAIASTPSYGTLANNTNRITLSAPTIGTPRITGSLTITEVVPSYLQFKWAGSATDINPSARATFGVYAPETRRTIHVRELF